MFQFPVVLVLAIFKSVSLIFPLTLPPFLPRSNHHGWLGIKNQFSPFFPDPNLLIIFFPLILLFFLSCYLSFLSGIFFLCGISFLSFICLDKQWIAIWSSVFCHLISFLSDILFHSLPVIIFLSHSFSSIILFVFFMLFSFFPTPWDNRNGWLGVKHQITYFPLFLFFLICCILFVFFILSLFSRFVFDCPPFLHTEQKLHCLCWSLTLDSAVCFRMPLTQCKQPFAAMDSHLRANVKSMIQENMTKYGLVFAAVTSVQVWFIQF